MKYQNLVKKLFFVVCSFSFMSAEAKDDLNCQRQTVANSVIEMCLKRGGLFQHDTYLMKADGVLIFALVDDYAEKVVLEHTIPPGLVIEFPLSKQGVNPIQIVGGCVPESKDETEIARVCNFHWGKLHVVKDVRFELK